MARTLGGMSTRRWLALGAIAIVALAVLVAVMRPSARGTPDASAGSTAGSAPTDAAAAASTPASPAASGASTPTAVAGPTTKPSPAPTPASPSRTDPPRATGDPRLAYAEFLLRVNDDRSAVDRLNRALGTATDDRDLDAVRAAAVDILDFVDAEHDWLREHPPTDCYAKAHASANAMLEAYGTAADRFIDWSAAGGGLAGLAAFGRAVDAAGAAADALSAFGQALDGTTCRA